MTRRCAAVFHLSLWTTVKQAPTTVQKLLDNTRNKEPTLLETRPVNPIKQPYPRMFLLLRPPMFSPIFNPRGVKVFGTVHKASEHAYQYVKGVREGYIPRAQIFDQRIQYMYLQQNKSGKIFHR